MNKRIIIVLLALGCFGFNFQIDKAEAQSCAHTPTSTNSIEGTININANGNYYIWSRMVAPNLINNSFYLQIDGGCPINIGDSSRITYDLTWVNYQNGNLNERVLVPLSSGEHRIKIIEREGGVGVDKIIFVSNAECLPSDIDFNDCVLPTPTPTNTPTPTPTPTSVPTATPTNTPAITLSPTAIATSTPTFTPIPTPTSTPTPTNTPTPTPTATPTPTSTPIPTPTSTPTPTNTPIPTPTNTPTPTTTRIPTATPAPAPKGLTGVYYDNNNFTGKTVTRIDPTINFNWGSNAPASGIAANTYSAVWTGLIVPDYSQEYTIYFRMDDGARVFINNIKLIDSWKNQSATEYSKKITLTKGVKYPIRVEYFQNYGGSTAQLRWSSASVAKQIVPQANLISK